MTRTRALVTAGVLLAASIGFVQASSAGNVAREQSAAAASVAVDDKVITLKGNVEFKVGGDTFSVSDGSRYHPDRKFLETSFLKSAAPLDGGSVSCNVNRVVVTYPDGTVIEADSMCAGGTRYTCRRGDLIQEVESAACV